MLPSWTVAVLRQLVIVLALASFLSTATPISSKNANITSSRTGPVLQARGNIFCCISSDSDSEPESDPLLTGSGTDGHNSYGTNSNPVQPTIENQIKTWSFPFPENGLPTFPGVDDLVLLLKAFGVVENRQAFVFYNDKSPRGNHFNDIDAKDWARKYMTKNDLTWAMQTDVYPQKWDDDIRTAMKRAIKRARLQNKINPSSAHNWLNFLVAQAFATSLKGDVYFVSRHADPRMTLGHDVWGKFIFPALTRNKGVENIYLVNDLAEEPKRTWRKGQDKSASAPRGRKEPLTPAEDTTVEPTEYELDNRFNYDPRYEIDKYDSPGLDMNY